MDFVSEGQTNRLTWVCVCVGCVVSHFYCWYPVLSVSQRGHTHTHTLKHAYTQRFTSTGVMSAGAQHGATCCYGDRLAPSDQQLLSSSVFPFLPISFFLFLLSSVFFSSFVPFHTSFSVPPVCIQALAHQLVNALLKRHCGARSMWRMDAFVTGHTQMHSRTIKAHTDTHVVWYLCIGVCPCMYVCMQKCASPAF